MKKTDKRVTLQDIADACGTSASTVSRVLNNSVLTTEDKRELVLETAERLGYRKRNIRKQQSRAILNIVLFLPETRSASVNLFYDINEFIKGLYQGFDDVKANVIVRINQSDDKGLHHKKLGDVDACIFSFTTPKPSLVKRIRERGIPLLLVNRYAPRHDSVIYDSEQAMGILVERMVAKARQRERKVVHLCYIGFPPVAYVDNERRAALGHACSRFGIPFDVERDVYEFQSIQDIPHGFTHTLHEKGYNAIVCFNDYVAIDIYNDGIRSGYTFPKDFFLTGYDDSSALELIDRRIDTIRFDTHRLGLESAKVLKRRIIGRLDKPVHIRLDCDYVSGDTL